MLVYSKVIIVASRAVCAKSFLVRTKKRRVRNRHGTIPRFWSTDKK